MRYFLFLTVLFYTPIVTAETLASVTELLTKAPNAAVIKAQSFTSSSARVALVELYTSEGCSSCPPADRWLSRLNASPRLWSDFIPVAFHVDYWDYIGWKDRFASKQYSQRQRQYANEQGEKTV